MQREIAQLLAVVAVNEHIELIKQCIHIGVSLRAQLLERKAGIAPDIETSFMCRACQREQSGRLQKGLTAGYDNPDSAADTPG